MLPQNMECNYWLHCKDMPKLISKCKTIRKWKKNHLSEIKILYWKQFLIPQKCCEKIINTVQVMRKKPGGSKTSQWPPEFCWLLTNMSLVTLVKIITFQWTFHGHLLTNILKPLENNVSLQNCKCLSSWQLAMETKGTPFH